MIYYYFGDKEGLYLAVLEAPIAHPRDRGELDLDHLPPVDALKQAGRIHLRLPEHNEDFIRLVMIENIHHGDYLAKSKVIQDLNVTAIDADPQHLRARQARRALSGGSRPGRHPFYDQRALLFQCLQPRDLLAIFKRDMSSAEAVKRRRPG